MGSSSGVGKTTICEGLLTQLLFKGYKPEQLAYIKPMTQCTDMQAITAFCESKHISHQSIPGLVFKKGFTKDFIDGLTKTTANLQEDILTEISRLSVDKDIVIVDGVGGLSTGSVIGISNVDIALSLNSPVLYVGKAGIGDAIDDTVLAVSFMRQQGIKNIALIYNKIQPSKLISIKYYVSKRIAELLPNVPILDFIPNHTQLDSQAKSKSASEICQWFNSQSFT